MTNDDSSPIPGLAPELEPGPGDPAATILVGDGDLPAVRALILAAHPDVVPDLVAGTTVAELLASVEGAQAAYAAVAQRLATSSGGSPTPAPVIPAGGGAPLPIDPDRLPASEKIRRGLRAAPAATGVTR
ncbi:MAG: hypothetical protein QM589_09185 [Thermomicrobiales bacterium]